MSCTSSYVGGGESPWLKWFANPCRACPFLAWWALNCCECKSVRLIVAVPLVIGADDGDIDVDGGKSGAVSALSSNGRL